jgi:hypothetical protein
VDEPIVAVQANVRAGRCAAGLIETKADTPHDLEQRPVCANASAAIGEVVAGPLEHVDVPADRSQLMRREQAPERATNDQRPPLVHPFRCQPTFPK